MEGRSVASRVAWHCRGQGANAVPEETTRPVKAKEGSPKADRGRMCRRGSTRCRERSPCRTRRIERAAGGTPMCKRAGPPPAPSAMPAVRRSHNGVAHAGVRLRVQHHPLAPARPSLRSRRLPNACGCSRDDDLSCCAADHPRPVPILRRLRQGRSRAVAGATAARRRTSSPAVQRGGGRWESQYACADAGNSITVVAGMIGMRCVNANEFHLQTNCSNSRA